ASGVGREVEIFEPLVFHGTRGHLFRHLAGARLFPESLVVTTGPQPRPANYEAHARAEWAGNGVVCLHGNLCFDRLVHVARPDVVINDLWFHFRGLVVAQRARFYDRSDGGVIETRTDEQCRGAVTFSRSG